MRSFIAIDAGNNLVLEMLNEFKRVKADVKLVEPQNLHLTLKFLGEIEERKVDDIYGTMTASFSRFSPFELSLFGVGAFPNSKYIRVVWVGLKEGKEKLIEMQHELDNNLSKLGIKKEDREFDPHLTIGRVKSPRGKEELREFIEKNRDRDFGKNLMNKVELKKSVLTPSGPIYSTVKEVQLK